MIKDAPVNNHSGKIGTDVAGRTPAAVSPAQSPTVVAAAYNPTQSPLQLHRKVRGSKALLKPKLCAESPARFRQLFICCCKVKASHGDPTGTQ